MESSNLFTWDKRTYIQEQRIDSEGKNYLYGSPIYFDVNIDTSKNSTVDLSESPIDAREGATLSDKRIVNMKTIGISGKYSSVNTNNSSFKVVENRLGIIIDYFEDALEKQRIYTVCRKGSIYSNMMINKVNLKFDEHCSTVTVALSFIEVIIIGVESELQNKIITADEVYQDILDSTGIENQDPPTNPEDFTVPGYHKQLAPGMSNYSWTLRYNHSKNDLLFLYMSVTDFNPVIEGYTYKGEIAEGCKWSTVSINANFTYEITKYGEPQVEEYNTTQSYKVPRGGSAHIIRMDFTPLLKNLFQPRIISPIKLTAWVRQVDNLYSSGAFLRDSNGKIREAKTENFLANPSEYIFSLEESDKSIMTIPLENIPDLTNN